MCANVYWNWVSPTKSQPTLASPCAAATSWFCVSLSVSWPNFHQPPEPSRAGPVAPVRVQIGVLAGASAGVHNLDACRGELDCLRLCPVDAVADGGAIPLEALAREPRRTLAVVATTTCPRCFARHDAASGSLCAACAFRVDNAFGSSLPPGAVARLAAARPQGANPGGGRATPA